MSTVQNTILHDEEWHLGRVGLCLEQHDEIAEADFRETILLVEDEEYIRKATREALERCGYKVLAAASAEEGIQVFDKHDAAIDLLLTDVVMPGMNGHELATRLARKKPLLKAIFMSGYIDNAVVQNGFHHRGVAYLQKPFSVNSLARKIREVIGNRDQGLIQHGSIN